MLNKLQLSNFMTSIKKYFIAHQAIYIKTEYDKYISYFYNKKQYLDLLLLADEQESMIDRYLKRGDMFVLAENNEIKASCVITEEGEGIYEIKNIAVYPQFQRQGYGKS